jgi:hypothetical protein
MEKKIEEDQEEFNFIGFFYIKIFLNSLQPNNFTAFTSFDPEKDY